MTKISDNRILTKAYNDFSRGLFRFANLKANDATLSDDLVQVTFLKTLLYLRKSGKVDLMRAFLYHVLNDLIVDEYRKKKTVSLDLLAEEGLEMVAIGSENIFNMIDAKMLSALIKKLPEKYRNAIAMRYTEDLSLKEMSAIMHQSENTMAVQVHRGLIQLRSLAMGTL